ncbi:MAG: hypothetical protein ACK5MV_12965 [Aminipila sp.]
MEKIRVYIRGRYKYEKFVSSVLSCVLAFAPVSAFGAENDMFRQEVEKDNAIIKQSTSIAERQKV